MLTSYHAVYVLPNFIFGSVPLPRRRYYVSPMSVLCPTDWPLPSWPNDLIRPSRSVYWHFWFSETSRILHWGHNGSVGVSNHQHHDCLLNGLFRRRSKHQSSESLAFVRGIHRGPDNSPHKGLVTWKIVSIWRRHQEFGICEYFLEIALSWECIRGMPWTLPCKSPIVYCWILLPEYVNVCKESVLRKLFFYQEISTAPYQISYHPNAHILFAPFALNLLNWIIFLICDFLLSSNRWITSSVIYIQLTSKRLTSICICLLLMLIAHFLRGWSYIPYLII